MIDRGMFRSRATIVAMTFLLGGCGGTSMTATDQMAPATTTWRLRVSADSDLQPGSVLLGLEGSSGTPSVPSPDGLFNRVSLGAEVRVLLAGDLAGRELIEVRGEATGVAPTASVLAAAADAAGGYAQLDPSRVAVEWVPVD